MSELPRGRCPVCRGEAAVRRNGTLRQHYVYRPQAEQKPLETLGRVRVCEGLRRQAGVTTLECAVLHELEPVELPPVYASRTSERTLFHAYRATVDDVVRPCACGGMVGADPTDPAPGLARHQLAPEHRAWREGRE